jgi:hypothetical protein
MIRTSIISSLFFAILLFSVESSWACATCFGAEGDPQTKGLNAAIFTLLGVTYTLFGGMALMAFLYWKKNRVISGDSSGEIESSRVEEAPTTNG